jgi:hypothetical protein
MPVGHALVKWCQLVARGRVPLSLVEMDSLDNGHDRRGGSSHVAGAEPA